MMLSRIPVPPTDSLHKFTAIAGVIMVVAGFVVGPLYESRIDAAQLRKVEGFSAWQTTTLTDAYEAIEKGNIKNEQQALSFVKDRASVLDAQMIPHNAEIVSLKKHKTGILTFSMVLIGLGGFLHFRGFRKWSLNLQQYQDRLMRIECARAAAQLVAELRAIGVAPEIAEVEVKKLTA